MKQRHSPSRTAFHVGSRRRAGELLEIVPPPFAPRQCAATAEALAALGVDLDRDAPGDAANSFLELLAAAHAALLREAQFFYPEPAEIAEGGGDGRPARLAVPAIPHQGDLALRLIVQLAKALAQTMAQQAPASGWLDPLRRNLAAIERPGPNLHHFIRAADALGMPVIAWPSGVIQVGYGARAALLNGSVSDRTPDIGVRLARDKAQCNAVLAEAGFPVAEGGLVANEAEARAQATALGYPVVVKPANRDGGKAVSSDIRDEAELLAAWRIARAESPRVIVEKHVTGRDHRLLFHGERLLNAIERIPGGVTGDGKATVAELVEQLNRARAEDTAFPRYPIALDAEAGLLLARRGFSVDSVVPKGEFLALRRAANFALGGDVRSVIDTIHPDNVDLARRAMRLLRLDIAGLDLILPDCTRSWTETGGAICEINAQPFIGDPVRTDFHAEILRALVEGDGRIPLVLVLGELAPGALARIETAIPGLAVVDGAGARFGGSAISRASVSWVQAGRAALLDPRVEAALFVLDPAGCDGLSPADRFTATFVSDAPDGLSWQAKSLAARAESCVAFAEVARGDLASAVIAALSGTD